jgi:[CysO sulfur-carrier protein]-S-L-cysteine hydrolase
MWTIPRSVVSDMEQHARDARPGECCGILIGLPGRVLESRRAANLAGDPNRFLVDPGAHVRALRESRHQHLEIVGFYHSHPHSAPIPSARDLAEASYPDLIHAIVGLQNDLAETQIYRLFGERFERVAVEVVDTPLTAGRPEAAS